MAPPRLAALSSPFQLGSLSLANRIVMAPMTRRFSPGGVPTHDVAAYYVRRALGGVGLILTEGTTIARDGARNHPAIPTFHGEDALMGWRKIVEAVHQVAGKIGPQLWHVGSVPNSAELWDDCPEMESPSGLHGPAQPLGRAMTEEDIADAIAAFAVAAGEAERAGFDVAELHGAHGYLIDQFFWEPTNRRSDRYGGDTLMLRSRFAIELASAVRRAVSPGFPIILRISQWKQQEYGARLVESPAALEQWLRPIVEAGADILHCSQRRFWDAEFPDVDGLSGLNLAGWAKKLTGAATITVGSVGLDNGMRGHALDNPDSLDALNDRLERGEFDLVAVGRALLSDAQWWSKIIHDDAASIRHHASDHMRHLS